MSHKRKSLLDVVIRLGHLLERPDLTDYERQEYHSDFVYFTRKCMTASDFSNEQDLQIALASVNKATKQKIHRKRSVGHQRKQDS